MENTLRPLIERIDRAKGEILAAERHIWKNPETGYREWKTHAYLKELYAALGYEVKEFGNIPGFTVDIDTGRPGPRVAVFGELDSLIVASHPESDPETHAVHACGHNCQSAGLYGVAVALADPALLSHLSGSIRLIAVPAEEMIEVPFRIELRKQGVIRFLGGKQEIIYRGVLDDCDIGMMIHTSSAPGIGCAGGSNGFITKVTEFLGKAAHAGGSPYNGHNALYAANLALNAANALRETFREKDYIRFHPIITAGGDAVNAIPDRVVVESYVRGATVEGMREANDRINLAFAGAAAAMRCNVRFSDEMGYMPRLNDEKLRQITFEAAADFFPEEQIRRANGWGTGSSDMGDVSTLIPSVHPHVGGAKGLAHSENFFIEDPEMATVSSAKVQVGMIHRLLKDGASAAKEIVAGFVPVFASREEYLKAMQELDLRCEGVSYEEDGTVRLTYKN